MSGPPTSNPITAATLGAALTVVLVWLLNLATALTPPAEVIVAFTTIVQFAVSIAWSKWGGFGGGSDA